MTSAVITLALVLGLLVVIGGAITVIVKLGGIWYDGYKAMERDRDTRLSE